MRANNSDGDFSQGGNPKLLTVSELLIYRWSVSVFFTIIEAIGENLDP